MPEPAEEYDGKPVLQSSQMYVEIVMRGNPFVKLSPTTKYLKLLEKTETVVHFKILSKMTGVPFSDSFALEEDFLILGPGPTASCCILRIMASVPFYKSTLLKSKITNGVISGTKDFWAEWNEWAKKRGILFKEKKAP